MKTIINKELVSIRLENVTISYGEYEAVKNVFLDIQKGKVTSLIGPSGCGKSTILRSINRMNDLIDGCYLKGRVLFEGNDLYDPKIDPVEVRRRIGMVFQQPNPFPKSIYENIAFGARINGFCGNMDKLVETSLRKAAVWDECKDKLKESGCSLSGGQQQRVAIARAVVSNPLLVLADEITANVDSKTAQSLLTLMEKLNKTNNTTFLFSTHDPIVKNFARKVILLKDGLIDKEEQASKNI